MSVDDVISLAGAGAEVVDVILGSDVLYSTEGKYVCYSDEYIYAKTCM